MDQAIELARDIALSMLSKSGIKDWLDRDTRTAIADAAVEMTSRILYGEFPSMALPDYFKVEPGTVKTITSSATSGNNYKLTLASLANGNGTTTGAKQSDTINLGANWAQRWRVDTEFELAATPTAGAPIHLYGSYGNATGAGKGNTTGTDGAYTGYSNNIDAAAQNHLEFLGDHVCTTQITATVQKGGGFVIYPKGQFLNLVVDDRSGAAFHSSDANCLIRLTPLENLVQDTV